MMIRFWVRKDKCNTTSLNKFIRQYVKKGPVIEVFIENTVTLRIIKTGDEKKNCGYDYRLIVNGNRLKAEEIMKDIIMSGCSGCYEGTTITEI